MNYFKKQLISFALGSLLFSCSALAGSKTVASLELGSTTDNLSGVEHYSGLATKKVGDIVGEISYLSAVSTNVWDGACVTGGIETSFMLNRYDGQTSLLSWAFDLGLVKGIFADYTLSFDFSNRSTGAPSTAIYVSYNDADTGKVLDLSDFSAMTPSSRGNAAHIVSQGYVLIGSISGVSGSVAIDLSAVMQASDDGKIRLLIGETSYLGAFSVAAGGGISVSSAVTSTPVASFFLPPGTSQSGYRFSGVDTVGIGSVTGKVSYLSASDRSSATVTGYAYQTSGLTLNRYAGQSSLLPYDYDLSSLLAGGGGGDHSLQFEYSGNNGPVEIYVSYNDAQTGKILDTDDFATLTPSSAANAAHPMNKGYVLLGALSSGNRAGLFSEDLSDVLSASDDGRVRVLFRFSGYKSKMVFKEGGVVARGSKPMVDYYADFISKKASNPWDTPLQEFSYAGYHRNSQAIPDVTAATHTLYDVTDFGAVPDDGLSDHAAVQAALAAIHQTTAPTILEFPAGTFHLYQSASDEVLSINRSHVVLRGAGLGIGGTTLVSRYAGAISVSPYAPSETVPYWRGTSVGNVLEQVSVRRGTFKLKVQTPANFTPGMVVFLCAKPDAQQEVDYYAPLPIPVSYMDANSPVATTDPIYFWLRELHEVESVNGDEVTFKEPILVDLQDYGQSYLKAYSDIGDERMLEEVGIEGLRAVVQMEQHFSHYRSDYGEAKFISINRTKNAWVRNIRTANYTQVCEYNSSIACGNFNLAMEGLPAHLQVSLYGSSAILTHGFSENTFTQTHHGSGASATSAGNVFSRCRFVANYEAHQKFPHSTLYDQCEGSFKPRGGGGYVHMPQHGRKLTFWNWRSTSADYVDFFDKSLAANYGYTVQPLVIGLHGVQPVISDPLTKLEVYDRGVVEPASLFEAQLADRLSCLPAWLSVESSLFETYRRYHRIELRVGGKRLVPGDFTEGQSASFDLEIPGDADLSAFTQAELLLSKQHYLSGSGESVVGGPLSMSSFIKSGAVYRSSQSLSGLSAGVYTVRARLLNGVGETAYSEPFVFIMRKYGTSPIEYNPVSLERRDELSATQPYPLNSGYGIFNKFHLDMGSSVPVDSIRVAWADSSGDCVVEIFTSNDPGVWSKVDNDAAWDLGAIYYTRSAVYPVPVRNARYVRVVIGNAATTLDSIAVERGAVDGHFIR